MAQLDGVSNPLAAIAAQAQAGGNAAKSSVADTEERFLTLLVTQMKNQDPLNPLDNAQITTQLAQLSTVTGINQLNDTLKGLSASFAASQVLQAAPLVGHDVMVAGSQLTLAGGRATFGVQLAQPVDNLTVDIVDAAGNLVHRAEAGPQNAGIVALGWDGAVDAGGVAPAGQYRFVLKAIAGGKAVDATALTIDTVRGVATGGSGVNVTLSRGGSAALADIRQIF
jgi:flagellar basal-body rod modification protein FlgD